MDSIFKLIHTMITTHFFLLQFGEITGPWTSEFNTDFHFTVPDLQLKTTPEDHQYVTLHRETSKTDQFCCARYFFLIFVMLIQVNELQKKKMHDWRIIGGN